MARGIGAHPDEGGHSDVMVYGLAALLPADGRSGHGGTEPDPRFTFANERTFLAWSRTALALVVAGLGIVQLLPPFPGVRWGATCSGCR